jgi:hypothetical protein
MRSEISAHIIAEKAYQRDLHLLRIRQLSCHTTWISFSHLQPSNTVESDEGRVSRLTGFSGFSNISMVYSMTMSSSTPESSVTVCVIQGLMTTRSSAGGKEDQE